MSFTEFPEHLFLQRSTSFSNSVKNDLEELIQEVQSDFGAVNRQIKIAPKLHRRSTIVDLPGSCTLDLKEFTRSKENVLRSLKTNFEEMAVKWNNEIEELKDWFTVSLESCLSKIQLQVTLTAEELNLTDPEREVEVCEVESSSSGSEIEVPVRQQSPRLFHNLKQCSGATKKRVLFADSIPAVPQQTPRPFYNLKQSPAATKKRVLFDDDVPPSKRKSSIPAKKAATITPTKSAKDRTVDVSNAFFSPAVSDSEQGIKEKADWMSLLRATEVAPSEPGWYEVKQSRAKSSAYIGHSEDLQKCLWQYLEGKSSHDKRKKQLESFIQRNKDEISVRYEVCFSPQLAESLQKTKLKEFLEKHKKPPAQNYGM